MAIAGDLSQAVEPTGHELRNRLAVRLWLYGICALVLLMVVVGGATRLTDSGLSITEWKPIHGVIPPLSEAEWQDEFDKYRQIPEYRQINRGMTIEGFKAIFWWEWAHRLLGRVIGVAFALPLAFFWISGRLEPALKPRLLALLALGGLQGYVGWWMVTSGLAERTDVSQYRLAVHLTLACLIFAYALWIARGLVRYPVTAPSRGLTVLAAMVTAAVMLQIFLGALVAGLDAGLAFNEWPLMDGRIIPAGLFVLDPAWLNFFENPKTVQFVHRTSGYALWLLVAIQWIVTLRVSGSRRHARGAALLFALVTIQATIGVATLLLQVPLGWALAHQAGAIVVLGLAVVNWRTLVGNRQPGHSASLAR